VKRPAFFSLLVAVAALAIAAGLAVLWFKRNVGSKDRPPAPAPAALVSPTPPPAPQPPDVAAPAPAAPNGDNEPASPLPPGKDPAAPEGISPSREQTLEAIQDLAVTYDAASVPALARYLSNRDAEIRAAARDGLIQLGERAAIPYLQEAARQAAPEEAQALREAAEFLALPTWTQRRAALKAQKKAGS